MKNIWTIIILSLIINIAKGQNSYSLDSLNYLKLKKSDYKINKDLFYARYGSSKYNEDAIFLYYSVRKKSYLQATLAAPIAIGGLLLSNYAINKLKNVKTQNNLRILTTIPLVGFGAGLTFVGIIRSVRYTKKHLLQDMILYKQRGIVTERISNYIDNDFD